ncbi:hypothetical protein [Azospirillum halopraeferens]|uniref:hypothetical protein n=1 Tax=Azospirillum halopraeferens TaxID=34010 RepID=UPI0004045290|nr:hypothetical protein [Azospirillum halopraeferens]
MQPFEKPLVYYLLQHLASGVAGAIVLASGILLLDIAGLGTLVTTSEHWFVATFLLYFGLSITFGSVAMGIGVMMLAEE